MEDISAMLCANLKLSEEEIRAALMEDFCPPETDFADQLLGNILCPRKIPASEVLTVFERAWNLRGALQCKSIHGNTFSLRFPNPEAKLRVLEKEPWIFHKFLFMLKEPEPESAGSQVVFTHTPFWIHVSEAPTGMYMLAGAEYIGNLLGKFLEVENDAQGSVEGEFLRIRVLLDVTKPLKIRQVVRMFGKLHPLPLKYEKLPEFCNFCGMIGHDKGDCSDRLKAPLSERNEIRFPNDLGTWPNHSPHPKNWNRKDGPQDFGRREKVD